MRKDYWQIWVCRALIGLVLFFNVQCAVSFLLQPGSFTPGFELEGEAGMAAVQGMGVLFLMWNVPYAMAFWHPLRRRFSLYEALTMQVIGLAGESLLLFRLPLEHTLLRGSIHRFILFDAGGLVLLALAALWVFQQRQISLPRQQNLPE